MEATEEDVEQLLQSLRERFAELETVQRPAIDGDFVVADVRAEVDGEELSEATRPDYLYAIGSSEFGPTMDAELLGKKPGDIITFDLAARTLSVNVSASELAERLARLPPPPQRATSGVMGKYARLVSSAAQGAITA